MSATSTESAPPAATRDAPQASSSWSVRLRGALPLLLAAVPFSVSVRSTPARYDARELLYFGLAYLLLGALLHACLRFGRACGRAVLALAALGVGFVIALEIRLDAERLVSPFAFVACGLGVAAFVGWLHGRGPRPRARAARLLGVYALAIAVTAWAVLGFSRTEGIRWHVLHHHRLFGLPAYRLLARSVPSVRADLWSAQHLVQPWERSDGVVAPRPVAGAGAPNVVVLLVDTLRADALAAFGGDPALMPSTNAWAERACVLRDVHANASWTRASVASLFTGLLPEEHGAVRFRDKLADAWHTLPEVLRDAGYQTAAFVTNWVQVGVGTGFDQGFDRFFELQRPDEIAASMHEGGGEIREQYARASAVHAATLAWLRGDERAAAAEEGRPVFLYLHYLDPHSPYLAGTEPGTEHDPRERKRGAYREELRYLDGELAAFLAALPEVLPGPTVVVFTSDHGEEFWEHGEWGHGHSLYDELVHVPTVVALPGGPAGSALDARLELRDLFDLVCAVARPEPIDLTAWAASRDRGVRYASQYLDRAADVRPDRKWTGLRRADDAANALIWSAFGPSLELYASHDAQQLSNRIDHDPESARALRAALEQAVRFWTDPPRVERSADDLAFLQALGYAGGQPK